MNTDDVMEARESQYATLVTEMQQLQPELESLNERKKNMQLINDQVGGWTQRVIAKMREQLGGMTIQTEDRSMVQVFREIAGLAKTQLSSIKQKREAADEEDSVADKEYMNDFASEDYVTKNIRVMPMTGGISIDNTSEHTSKYYTSGMGAVN